MEGQIERKQTGGHRGGPARHARASHARDGNPGPTSAIPVEMTTPTTR
jgi:hypothetical protein